uniref:Putative ATP synthase F0 c subunit n=1 Tax=Pseudomonas veronii TaxID=76761 RepID=Q0MRF9_PSEVE|nr:putative ATP synthase F0 c subunit [Pseudomonas veronii]
MDSLTWIAVASIVMAGLTTGFGTMGPALAEGRAVSVALTSLAQQPDASATITRTLFVGLAMIESMAILLLCRVDDPDLRQPILECPIASVCSGGR